MNIPRYLFGLSAIGFGVCALVWHTFPNWDVIKGLGSGSYQAIVTDIVGAIEILAGVAILVPRTLQVGAIVLGVLFCVIALLGVPLVIAHPLVYNGYGNVFEQLSLASGAALLARSRLTHIAYYVFAACVISFALEQAFYLPETAGFVPKWIPLGQMFWAVATTVAFGAAALALLTRIKALLAAQLTTAMLIGFGLLVWVPTLIADSHTAFYWSETIETFGIAAVAWIVVGYLQGAEVSGFASV